MGQNSLGDAAINAISLSENRVNVQKRVYYCLSEIDGSIQDREVSRHVVVVVVEGVRVLECRPDLARKLVLNDKP